MVGTGVGKTLFMCHLMAFVAQGLNVLYITLEMVEHPLKE